MLQPKNPDMIPQQLVMEKDDVGDSTEIDKPFKPGDYIFISTPQVTLTGRVLTVGTGYTKLKSNWGSFITIPDSIMSKATVTNLSEEENHLQIPLIRALEKDERAEAL